MKKWHDEVLQLDDEEITVIDFMKLVYGDDVMNKDNDTLFGLVVNAHKIYYEDGGNKYTVVDFIAATEVKYPPHDIPIRK